MRENLIQYVDLLFAGAGDCEEVKEEILQNTLDRYDDLVDQGKAPEAAYRLAISGIGDVNEILGSIPRAPQPACPEWDPEPETPESRNDRMKHAISVAMYILCPVPLFILSEFGLSTIGLCLTLLMVAIATALRLTMRRPRKEDEDHRDEPERPLSPRQKLRKSIDSLIWALGLAIYFILSFSTGAWAVTWIIFPLIGAVQGLVQALFDLKEVYEHEN